MKNFILLLCFVFFVMGCGVSRKAASHSVQKDSRIENQSSTSNTLVDSIVSISEVTIDTTKVKAEFIKASVSTEALIDSNDNLKKIIELLNYELLKEKVLSGSKAGVSINYDSINKRINVIGTCDSSEILSLRKSNRELRSINKELREKQKDSVAINQNEKFESKEVKTTGVSIWNVILYVLASFLMGCIGGLLIKTFILR